MAPASKNKPSSPCDEHYWELSTFGFLEFVAAQKSISGVTDRSLRNLLDLLEPEPLLERLFLVLRNLQQVFQALHKIPQNDQWKISRERLLSAKKLCDALFNNRNKICEYEILEDVLGRKSLDLGYSTNNNSFRGSIQDYPLWSTLGHLPSGKVLDQFYQMLAHVLLSTVAISQHPAGDILKNTRNQALEAIRGLAKDKESKELFALPAAALSTEEYLKAIDNLPASFQVHKVASFLEEAVDFTSGDWVEHHAKLVETPFEMIDAAADVSAGSENHTGLEEHIPTGFDILLSQSKGAESYSVWKGAQISKSLAKSNQLFPFDWSCLSRRAVEVLVNFLDLEKTPVVEPQTAQARVALQFMLWAGMNEERLAGVGVKSSTESVENCNGDFYNPSTRVLRVSSPYPTLKTDVSPAAREKLYARQCYLDLPLPEMAATFLNYYLEHCEKESSRLLTLSPAQIRTFCQKELNSLAGENTSRLSLVRIQSFLHNHLARAENGDPAAAMLILGKEHYLGRSKVHYAAFESYDLQELYRKTTHGILQETGRKSVFSARYPAGKTLHVGTPKRPKIATIQELFGELVTQICQLRSSLNSAQDLIEFHNLFTTYTAVVIFFSTGHRPIRTPYILPENYDPMTGFCVMRDKDTQDYYHTRLLWLPKVCRDQLRHYRAHLTRFFDGTTSSVKGAPQGQAEVSAGQMEFFYLKENFEVEEVRPQPLTPRLEALGYSVPLNSQRHFLKSELQESGCAWDVVELFLGHWEAGEEGYTKSSALFPFDYRRELDSHLTPLLKRLGVSPLKGLSSFRRAFGTPCLILPLEKDQTQHRHKSEVDWRPDRLPGEIWYQAIGSRDREKEFGQAFSVEQRFVLRRLLQKLPALYHGGSEMNISQKDVESFYYRLTRHGVSSRQAFKRQFFFHRALEKGNQGYQWGLYVSPPKILPRDANLLRPSVGPELLAFRRIEEAFIRDLEKPLPDTPEHRVGQIILSAILYGGLHHPGWLKYFPLALADRIYQHKDWLWLDLWSQKEQFGFVSEKRFFCQMEPLSYRRWVAYPTSQILIYRWLHYAGGDRALCKEFQIEKILQAYLERIGISLGGRKGLLKKLTAIGSARALITLPTFIAAFAKNRLPSTSLPDERWLRFLTGKTVAVNRLPAELEWPSPLPPGMFFKPQQNELRKELCKILKVKNVAIEDVGYLKDQIQSFLDRNKDAVSPVLHLLAQWAIYLRSQKTSPLDRHDVKGPLKFSTVTTYINDIADSLFSAFRGSSPVEMDQEELCVRYEALASYFRHKRKSSPGLKDNLEAYKNVIQTTNHFHRFLQILYEAPDIDLDPLLGKDPKIGHSERVSANILSSEEFLRIRNALGWALPFPTRTQKMVICSIILAYRCGLRRNEILGLRLKDMEGEGSLDVLVRPHKGRRTKSSSAKRPLPQDLLAPSEEEVFLRDWIGERSREPGTAPSSYLFTPSPLESGMITDSQIFGTLRSFIKQVTGDDCAVLHHLRHSFETNLIARLLHREDIQLNTVPEFFKSFSADPLHPELRNAIEGNEITGRKKLRATAIMIGHQDVETGIFSYFHLCDFLLGYYCRHESVAPRFTSKALAQVLNVSEK